MKRFHLKVIAAFFGTLIAGLCVRGIAHAQESTINWKTVGSDEPQIEMMLPTSASGVQYLLEKVVVKGNRKTLRSVILRLLQIAPGDQFSAEDDSLEESRYRMLASGLFREVSFELKKGKARGYVILEIKVIERNTIVINDLSFGLTTISPKTDEIVPFGSIGVLERSFLGTDIKLGGTLAASEQQSAYRIYLRDDHFLNSRFGIHVEGLFADAEETFGKHYLWEEVEGDPEFGKFEVLDYRRAGIRLGTGYNLLTDYFFWCDFRFENILREEPRAILGPDSRLTEEEPEVRLGYMEPDDSVLTSALFGFTRDTTNHPVLPSDGSNTQLSIELSHPIIGSDYSYVKFLFNHLMLFPFGIKGQSIGVETIAGLITGSAPFFEQFFVGDYSAFAPNRILGLNFSNLHPAILGTDIENMWYEDLVLSISAEWSRPLYRGSGNLYGLNLFVRFGAFALTSANYIDGKKPPIDISGDFGLRLDTSVGVFTFTFTNVLQLIPPVRRETTSE
ncbi:MAG: BamA/TamA family outer membrane protein [Deltaproteobacteria bacterium]|nr:BamA/TamA family outer membrane protein [Deltaproteobacteria bacterium]